MTGFGRASGALSARWFVAVTAKSVNHRYLEVSVRLPEFFWELEPLVRAIAAETFSRGKLDISIRVQRTQQPEYSVRINGQIANSVIPQLKSIAEELGIGGSFSGSDLMRVPDLLQVEPIESEIGDDEREELSALIRDALAQLTSMRLREGESLHTDITSRLVTIRELQARLATRRDAVRDELLASFKQRVADIAAAAGDVTIREDRLAQEVVLMVEKGDIAEELTRLTHHIEQMDKAIGGNEPSGKKLDFITQEMLREINTMGSKSRTADIRTVVVDLKTEVERIREQVQNVE
jgi:uncharacterized protein (TIGR00255 family)